MQKLSISLAMICLVLSTDIVAAQSLIRISNFDDFNFGTWSGSGGLTLDDGLCVTESAIPAPDSRYRITASGSGVGGDFTVLRTTGPETLDYRVFFQGSTGGRRRLQPNVTRTFRNSLNALFCGATNATLRIRFRNADLSAAIPGDYAGVVTVTMEP